MEFGTARSPSKIPPGPPGYPLLGVFPIARRDPLGFFRESARRYGDVVSMRFGVHRMYLLSHPDHVKHVLHDHHQAYGKSSPAARVRPLFGDSLTAVDGAHWRQQRRLMRPAFQPKDLGGVVPVVTEATADMLDRWQGIAKRGETVDLLKEMNGLTQTIILRVLFGDVASVTARAVGEALDLAVEHVDRCLWSPLGWLVTPANRRFRQALRTVDGFVSGMVAQARGGAAPRGSLLSTLLNARDADTGERMSDAELRDELKALLVAGHTTTASALGWIWYALFENPEVRQRLERELRAVLDGRPPHPGDLPTLPYTRMLIEEVLRLFPPTWVTARMAHHEDEIGGYRVAEGTVVLLSPYVTHRHPGFWEDPDRFDPERFTPERGGGRPAFAYFPFGGGPRSCVGSWFALVEMQLVVAIVAQRYQLAVVPGSRIDAHPGLTLRPCPGVPMILY